MLGSFIAALCVLVNSHDAILHFSNHEYLVPDKTNNQLTTAEIFATNPKWYVTNTQAFFDTMIGNMMLSMFIFAITDKKNMNIKSG